MSYYDYVISCTFSLVLLFIFVLECLFYVYESFASCMYVYGVHACLIPIEVRKGIRSLRTGVMDVCEHLCGCWVLNPGPLEEQTVLFTELLLQPQILYFITFIYMGSNSSLQPW